MFNWLKRIWPFKKKERPIIPYPGFMDMGPCRVTWEKTKGMKATFIWPMAMVKINWKQPMTEVAYADVQLNLPDNMPLLTPIALKHLLERFDEKRELRIEDLYPEGENSKIFFNRTSLKLIDMTNKVVKYKIWLNDNLEYGRIE